MSTKLKVLRWYVKGLNSNENHLDLSEESAKCRRLVNYEPSHLVAIVG